MSGKCPPVMEHQLYMRLGRREVGCIRSPLDSLDFKGSEWGRAERKGMWCYVRIRVQFDQCRVVNIV